AYMAPEQLEGCEADSRSDIFSIGVILYQLATGMHPFLGASTASTIANIMSVTPHPMACGDRNLPEPLNQIVFRSLAKNCNHRYQTTRELLAVLQLLESSSNIRSSELNQFAQSGSEISLVHQWLGFVKPTPRRWWEINQFFCLAAYPVVAYMVWRVRAWMPENWEPAMVGILVGLAALTTTLRLYLLFIAAFVPALLESEALRWR